ncbi:MAG: zinc-finger-containing protein [Bacteroidales bacterium]
MIKFSIDDLKKYDQIYSAEKCPYCGKSTELGNDKHGAFYRCKPCNAYVGTHRDTTNALGRLANAGLREAKMAAHDAFDKLWKEGDMDRKTAYKYLSGRLSIPVQYTHIGYFSVATCKQVVLISEEKFSRMELKSE